jgi:hypothetical protein
MIAHFGSFTHWHALEPLCLRYAEAGFGDGRGRAKFNGKVEFASQNLTSVTFFFSTRNNVFTPILSIKQLQLY